jgi:hypothetical protein
MKGNDTRLITPTTKACRRGPACAPLTNAPQPLPPASSPHIPWAPSGFLGRIPRPMPDIYNCERAATTPLGGFFPAIGSMFGRKKAHSLRPWQKERLSFQHPRPARPKR